MVKKIAEKTAIEDDSVIADDRASTMPPPSTIHRSESEMRADILKEEEPVKQKHKATTEEEKKLFASNVFKSFSPYRYFCYIFLRFPLQGAPTSTGGFLFTCKKTSIHAIGYIITSVIVTITAFLFLINTVGSALDFPAIQPEKPNATVMLTREDYRFEEQYIVRRNIIPLIILISSLCHSTVGSWQLYQQRHFAARYFTFWTEIVQVICIDVADGVKRYMSIIMISYAAFLVVFFMICAGGFAPVSTGGPGLLAMYCIRIFNPQIHIHDKFWIARGFGGILFFYVIVCSKTFVLLFVLICRLLRNAFSVWNNRLERVLIKGEDKLDTEDKLADRTDFSLLFKDHVCLLEAMEGADVLFANIIESYYASQVCSIIFEVYYFYRSQSSEEFKGARRLDGIIITLYLVHSLAILMVVSLAAAEVGEVAMEGLEVLRRRGMMGRMDDDELYFIMSMYTSYTGHFETALRGAGYFTLDKGFLVTIVGVIFSYFIILLQFSPPLAITKPIDAKVTIYNTSRLIKQVESSIQIAKGLQVGYLQFKQVANFSDIITSQYGTTFDEYNNITDGYFF